jgi:hypothetical protein
MIHPKINFTTEEESDNKTNYLDITILKTYDKLSFGIYWKPTTSDLIIHNDSSHPYEHKKAAITTRINIHSLMQTERVRRQ